MESPPKLAMSLAPNPGTAPSFSDCTASFTSDRVMAYRISASDPMRCASNSRLLVQSGHQLAPWCIYKRRLETSNASSLIRTSALSRCLDNPQHFTTVLCRRARPRPPRAPAWTTGLLSPETTLTQTLSLDGIHASQCPRSTRTSTSATLTVVPLCLFATLEFSRTPSPTRSTSHRHCLRRPRTTRCTVPHTSVPHHPCPSRGQPHPCRLPFSPQFLAREAFHL